MNRLLRFFSTSILLIQAFITTAQPSFVKKDIDAYIEQGMKDWNIPGLAIVIVKDGKVELMKGYGVKDIQHQEPVNAQTLFFIASNTKLFTGTALAQLDYNKKLSLDDKIIKYFPSYKLYDAFTTEQVSIKDMLSHRLGTKTFQGDFTFFNGSLSRGQIMYGMRFLKPVGKFRQDYGYCNSCFLTAGEVIPKVTGKPWEVYVYDSIIAPLAMSNTHVLSVGADRMPNIAKPYTTSFTGSLQEVPYDAWDNLAPAASIISNVQDLSHWLQMQLDSGKYNGKQVMRWPILQKTRDVNIVTSSRKSAIYPMHFRGYGLGVYIADYNGRQIYWHTGGASGMVSNVCFVPEEKLGIAILTNNDNQSFFELLRYQLLDVYTGMPFVNRSQQQLAAFQKNETESLQQLQALKARIKENSPTLALKEYEGTYVHELYGKITMEAKDKHLLVHFKGHDNLTASLDYLDNGEWLLQYNNILYGIFPVKFVLKAGKVVSIDIKANDFVEYDSYTFIKQ
jgi:CubicO group peptidase (beta-lactamase class C family)